MAGETNSRQNLRIGLAPNGVGAIFGLLGGLVHDLLRGFINCFSGVLGGSSSVLSGLFYIVFRVFHVFFGGLRKQRHQSAAQKEGERNCSYWFHPAWLKALKGPKYFSPPHFSISSSRLYFARRSERVIE